MTRDRSDLDFGGILGAWMNEPGRRFTIVRPDHYVYGTAATLRDMLQQLDSLSATLGVAV